MFGVPLNGPTDVFCNNQAVVNISQPPYESISKKKNYICYHHKYKTVSAGYVRVANEPTETNLSDIFTNIFPGPKSYQLATAILY